MKRCAWGIVLVCLATAAQAGGPVEPVMEPAVVEAETASSGGDAWVGIGMALLLLGTAVAN